MNFQKEIHEKRELWVPVKLSTLGPKGQVRVCLLAPVLLREPGYGVGARDRSIPRTSTSELKKVNILMTFER